MGVEEVLMDAFTRAWNMKKDVKKRLLRPPKKKGAATAAVRTVRRDLELDALVEIMNKKDLLPATPMYKVRSPYHAGGRKFGFPGKYVYAYSGRI